MTEASSVGHVPAKDKWEFDESVTAVFDDMLTRSIPQYEVMRGLVTDLATEFGRRVAGGNVVDLGSSRGEALAPVVEELRGSRIFYALECSPPMLDVLRKRFENEADVRVRAVDLREGVPIVSGASDSCSVVLSVLTLQFVPINYRQRIVRDVWRNLVTGGAFVLVEKVLGDSADIDGVFVDRYHALKGANGYGQEEIERKRMSLEGVLVPVTAAWNVDLLRQAGFRQVDCFWRWANFAGFLAVKG